MLKRITVPLSAVFLVSLNAFALEIELSTTVPAACTIERSASSFSPDLVAGESVHVITNLSDGGYTVTFNSANGTATVAVVD